jgi:endoglucanase
MVTAIEFVKQLGLGWNAGNTLDAFPCNGERDETLASGRRWTPDDQQRLWGNTPLTASILRNVKAAGFDTVRIPVTWRDWTDTDGNVESSFMDTVRQVVDWSLAAGLYVILNVHHDGSVGDELWIRKASRDYNAVSHRFVGLWRNIAEQFADVDSRLILEGANEVGFPDVDTNEAYDLLNRLNQLFVDTVRAVGGCNSERFLLIPGYDTDTVKSCDVRYALPHDSTHDKLIQSIHYYSPSEFAIATHDSPWCKNPRLTWGSAEEVAAMNADFDMLQRRFVDRGVPVIIGEYAVLTGSDDHKDHDSNIRWIVAVTRNAMSRGICPIIWDTSSKEMCFLNRETGEFFDPDVTDLFANAR